MTTRTDHPTDRRSFLGLAAAVAAAGISVPAVASAHPTQADNVDEQWLTRLTGKHKQYFDAVSPNEGWVLAFALAFMNKNKEAYGLNDSDITTVIGLRHFAICLGFNDTVWSKYKFGELFKVTDHATNAPALRNVFVNVHDGDLMFPDGALEKLMARGAIVTLCNHAVNVLSGMVAGKMGSSADTVKQEWIAGMLPGTVLVPAGVLAVNRAQEHGCSYCYAG